MIRTLAAVVATAALSVLASLAVWSALPALAGWHVDVVMSGSMAPSVQPGDLVLSEPVAAGTVWPGQVVLFRAEDGRTLVHRVREVAGDGSFVTRGDANVSDDTAPVRPDQVLGLARLRVPWIGLPVLWWHEQAGLPLAASAIGAVAAVVAASTDTREPRPAPTPAPLGRRARRALSPGLTEAVA